MTLCVIVKSGLNGCDTEVWRLTILTGNRGKAGWGQSRSWIGIWGSDTDSSPSVWAQRTVPSLGRWSEGTRASHSGMPGEAERERQSQTDMMFVMPIRYYSPERQKQTWAVWEKQKEIEVQEKILHWQISHNNTCIIKEMHIGGIVYNKSIISNLPSGVNSYLFYNRCNQPASQYDDCEHQHVIVDEVEVLH